MRGGYSADFEPLVPRNAVDAKVRDALRLFVGRGRRYSVKQLAIGAHVPSRMIEAAIAPLDNSEFRPLAREYLWSVMKFLRAPFVNELLALIDQGAFDLPDTDIPSPGELTAECANDTAEVAGCAADGEFDERDERELKSVGLREIDRGMLMVASVGRRKRRAA